LLKSKREDSYLLRAEEEVEVALAGRRKMKKEYWEEAYCSGPEEAADLERMHPAAVEAALEAPIRRRIK